MDTRKLLKLDTRLVIVSVIILTIVTLNVSYSALFSVQSASAIQEIQAGTLNVSIDVTRNTSTLFPVSSNANGLPTSANSNVTGAYAIVTLENEGTLDADYSISIDYDDELPVGKTSNDLVDLRWVIVGIYDTTELEWVPFSDSTYNKTITNITPNEEGAYPILRDTIDVSETKQYRIYIWLNENTPVSEINKLAYLKIDVKSTTLDETFENEGE